MSKITSFKARKILDSRGEWTLEVRALTDKGAVGVVSVPRGKSRGAYEAAAVSVDEAIHNIEKKIVPALKGLRIEDQGKIDERLIELDGTDNKTILGANAMLAASLACSRAAAAGKNIPLWQYLQEISGLKKTVVKPRLFVNVINGGLHAGNNLVFQEYLIIPRVESISQAANLSSTVYGALRRSLIEIFGQQSSLLGDEGGFAPDFGSDAEPFEILEKVILQLGLQDKFDFGLDAAANSVKTEVSNLEDLYRELRQKHNLWYLEDPFSEDDFDGFAALLKDWGGDRLICGDDLTVTNITRIKQAYDRHSVNSVIIKPNQIGTLTETLAAVKQAREYGWKIIVSHRSGETNDDFIADLAYGLGADGIKLGAPARGERTAKYNRLLAIEEEQ